MTGSGSGSGEGVGVGSSLSARPRREWKPWLSCGVGEGSAVDVGVMMGERLLQWAAAAPVACCAEGLDSSEVRVQWAVKAGGMSTRRAAVGQRRSAGTLLSVQGDCGAQTA